MGLAVGPSLPGLSALRAGQGVSTRGQQGAGPALHLALVTTLGNSRRPGIRERGSSLCLREASPSASEELHRAWECCTRALLCECPPRCQI